VFVVRLDRGRAELVNAGAVAAKQTWLGNVEAVDERDAIENGCQRVQTAGDKLIAVLSR
jgi:hypothetical protein